MIPDVFPTSSPDLIGYMNNRDTEGLVRIIVSFKGCLDEARLSRAVRLAFDAEPVIGCKFVEGLIRPHWRRCRDLEKAFELHVISASDAEKAMYDFYLAPMDPYSGPQARVALYRSDVDTMYIKMSHIVADGGASIEYLQLLANIYRSLGENPDFRPATNIHGSRSSHQALKHIGFLKILKSCTHISLAKSTWELPSVGDTVKRPSYFIKRIDSRQLSRIKAYSKARGATMGDILMTAYYRALFKIIDPPEDVPLPLLVPINLRRYIPGGHGEGICSLTAGYFPKIRRKREESFDDTLAKVRTEMENNKSKQEELGQLFLMELAFAPGNIVPRILKPFLTSLLVFPTFSNIGIVEPSIADFGDVAIREVLPMGPMSSPPSFVLGANSSDGELTLTTIINSTDNIKSKVEDFFDTMIKELQI